MSMSRVSTIRRKYFSCFSLLHCIDLCAIWRNHRKCIRSIPFPVATQFWAITTVSPQFSRSWAICEQFFGRFSVADSAPNSGRTTPVSMADNKPDVIDSIADDDDDDDVIPLAQTIASTDATTPNSLIGASAITTAAVNALSSAKSASTDVGDADGKCATNDTAAKDKEVRFFCCCPPIRFLCIACIPFGFTAKFGSHCLWPRGQTRKPTIAFRFYSAKNTRIRASNSKQLHQRWQLNTFTIMNWYALYVRVLV